MNGKFYFQVYNELALEPDRLIVSGIIEYFMNIRTRDGRLEELNTILEKGSDKTEYTRMVIRELKDREIIQGKSRISLTKRLKDVMKEYGVKTIEDLIDKLDEKYTAILESLDPYEFAALMKKMVGTQITPHDKYKKWRKFVGKKSIDGRYYVRIRLGNNAKLVPIDTIKETNRLIDKKFLYSESKYKSHIELPLYEYLKVCSIPKLYEIFEKKLNKRKR